jgi:hypothetical protein
MNTQTRTSDQAVTCVSASLCFITRGHDFRGERGRPFGGIPGHSTGGCSELGSTAGTGQVQARSMEGAMPGPDCMAQPAANSNHVVVNPPPGSSLTVRRIRRRAQARLPSASPSAEAPRGKTGAPCPLRPVTSTRTAPRRQPRLPSPGRRGPPSRCAARCSPPARWPGAAGVIAGVRVAEHRGHERAGLPGPPRPGRAPGTATGTGRMHARLSPGRQATRSPVTRQFRLRPRARLPTAVDGGPSTLDHWSKPIAARAGSVLARMFRYGTARHGTRWH